MIGFIFISLMIFETIFLDAQAKYRSVLDATTHRKPTTAPYTDKELDNIDLKWSWI